MQNEPKNQEDFRQFLHTSAKPQLSLALHALFLLALCAQDAKTQFRLSHCYCLKIFALWGTFKAYDTNKEP